MARLSTGQAYGATGRATAAQLLGGIPVDGFAGELAQGSISEPTLQPQARPVSTFQQTGAPTLGGAPKFFPLPDMLTPSQDLARLATALGNFNPVLLSLGESYIQQQKSIDTKAQAVGQAVAMQLSQTAPGKDFIQARDSLWRQSQAGDADAAVAYQQMQALSPLQQAYTARYAGQAILREDIATAADRFKNITEIGGVPIDQIEPGDLRISAAKSALYRLPINDPAGFAEMMPLVAAKNGEIDRLHMGMRLTRKVNEARASGQANTVSPFMQSEFDVAGTVANHSQMLTRARQDLGVEEYQKHVQEYPDWLATGVLAGSMGKDGKVNAQRYHYLMGKALDVLTNVQAGPNGQLLLTTLGAKGGTAAQLGLTQKMMAQLKTFNESINSFNGSVGEEKGVEILSITNATDPNLTPADRDARFVQADLMAAALPDGQRQGAQALINKERTQANTSWTSPLQAQAAREMSFDLSKDPATEIAKIEQLTLSGLLPPGTAGRLTANYREAQSAEFRPYFNAAKTAKAEIMKQEMDRLKLPGSEGDGLITENERLFLVNRSAELDSSLEVLRRQSMADGNGPAGFQSKTATWLKEQKPQAPQPPNPNLKPLMPQGPEAWARSLGFFGQMGPGNAAANYQLKQRVDNGVVMPPAEFLKNYDDYVENGRLSDAMKLLIKRSGYGATPSQFFFKQWGRMAPQGVKMNPDDVETLKLLDRQKISSAQPGAGGVPVAANPYSETAARLGRLIANASTGAINALVPPAAAAGMPSTRARPATGMPSTRARPATGTQKTGWNSIVAAARAAGAKFPELVAAQWALESDWGRSVSGRNNFFGQKGPGTSKATWEVVNGRRVNTTASFRDFATAGDSVNFLIGKWYKGRGGANNARTIAEAARILKQQGYATDPQYVNKLLSIVNSNKKP